MIKSTDIRMLKDLYFICRIITFSILLLILHFDVFASQPVDLYENYLDADLVIVGNVLSCSTKIIEEKELPETGSWIWHCTKFMNIHMVRVDSVIKGSFSDTTLIIQNESFKTYYWREEKGDSLSSMKIRPGIGDESVSNIPGLGKFIIILKKKDGIYTSTLCMAYDKSILDFYKKIQEKGKGHFKKFESSPK